jgi:hypothetical protein
MNQLHHQWSVDLFGEPCLKSERQLDPAGPSSNDDDPVGGTIFLLMELGDSLLEEMNESGDGSGWKSKVPDAGQIQAGNGGTDIGRSEIERDPGFVSHDNLPVRRVDSGSPGQYDPRSRSLGESRYVDLEIGNLVLAGDESRNHPRVDRHRGVDDDSDPEAWDRLAS